MALASMAAVTLFSSAALAQSAKPISLGISAGAAIPVGDFGDLYTTGYNGTVSLGIRSAGSPLGLRFDGMYNRLSLKDDASINVPGFGLVESSSITSANGNIVFNLPGTGMTPYLIGGAGAYWTKLHGDGFSTSSGDPKLGINGGIGAAFPLSGFNTFIEARLHHIFQDNDRSSSFIPVTFGISF